MNTILVINTNGSVSDNSRDSFLDAARRWNCDYKEVTEFNTPWHPASIKLKAFDLTTADRIMVLDSDTIIRFDAPSIFDAFPDPTQYYAVKNTQSTDPPVYQHAAVGLASQQIDAILANKCVRLNLDKGMIVNGLFNSGVTVISRPKHEEYLTYAYYLYLNVDLQWWDQVPTNVACYALGGGYTEMGVTWNRQFPPSDVSTMQNFLYHYAGNPERYEILRHVNWRA
jgi:lipopolysaccharide biosynthesis glycosyltransferase